MHTLDQGLQLVYWAGQRKVSWCGSMAPIEIAAGALGNWPRLVVSPQHRMLIEGWRAEIYFGQRQVLSAAVHLAFEQHEIIFAIPPLLQNPKVLVGYDAEVV